VSVPSPAQNENHEFRNSGDTIHNWPWWVVNSLWCLAVPLSVSLTRTYHPLIADWLDLSLQLGKMPHRCG